jgi:hypothetical protein
MAHCRDEGISQRSSIKAFSLAFSLKNRRDWSRRWRVVTLRRYRTDRNGS